MTVASRHPVRLAALVLALAVSQGACAAFDWSPSYRANSRTGGGPQFAADGERLGVSRTRTLDSFAAELGVRLGASDDGRVFAAANTAIIAAKSTGGLAVALPMGRTEHTSTTLLLDNNGGYYCPVAGRCTVQPARASDSAAPTWLVAVNDPYATNLILSGIVFYGGWNWARAPYATAAESDPWLDHEGGVKIAHAFSGVNDSRYVASSAVGTQLPRDHIEDLVIAGFGGDCLVVSGAGQNEYHNIRGQNCGGHGIVVDSYDNKFSDIDFGATGRACLLLTGQGSANNVQGKVWYCGSRLKADDDQGVRVLGGGNLMSLIIQDTYGDGLENAGGLNLINAIVAWQGELAKMDPGPITAYSCVGCDHNTVTLLAAVSRSPPFPNVTQLYRSRSNGRQLGSNNVVAINEANWPGDEDGSALPASWVDGPQERASHISINGAERGFSRPGADGQMNFAAGMNGSATGVILFGPGSAAPGKVAILCQGETNSACILQGYRNADGKQAYTGALTWDRDGRVGMPSLPGPFTDDRAAATGGVAPGQLYRDAASVVHVRTGP